MLILDETVWLTPKAMAELFSVGVPVISKHLSNVFESCELQLETTMRRGKRKKLNPISKEKNKEMTETNRIEYKTQLTKDLDLEKEVVAFLNYHEGGLVYIGVDKNGKTLGVADPDADMLKIKDRIKNNISPSAMGLFDVVGEEKNGKTIIKIIVASGSEKPYFKKKYG